MPNWKVELIAEAHADFNRLDGSVKKQVLKQFAKLERNPKHQRPPATSNVTKALRLPAEGTASLLRME